MISVKQIFVILSIFASLASAKKGTSARKIRYEADGRQLYSKKNYINPYDPPAGVHVNRDGTVLDEPNACISFQDAEKWVEAGYEGDEKCRSESSKSNPLMGQPSACCRLFTFSDTSGTHRYRFYDVNNLRPNVQCVCNENTAANNSAGGIINIPSNSGSSGGGMIDITDRDGGVGGIVVPPPPAPTPAVATPTAAPGPNQCSAGNIGQTQLNLQNSPYMVPCEDSSPCGDNKCCFSNYCVCWPTSQLVPGTSYCL